MIQNLPKEQNMNNSSVVPSSNISVNRSVATQYTLFPKNKKELKQMIKEEISKQGPEANLNHINVSKIKDFSNLFCKSDFNGDISDWDVSNVTNMSDMFAGCYCPKEYQPAQPLI